nr:uncharacterized protein LOC115104323 isoform X1 [Oncorhynchus nerka]
MGRNASKEAPELTGDERYMAQKDKRNIDFGLRWREKYDFDGRLNVEKLESLIKQIHKECGNNVKKQDKQGLYTARVWLTEARKRVEVDKKKKKQDTLPSAPTVEKNGQSGGGGNQNLYPSLVDQAYRETPDDKVVMAQRRGQVPLRAEPPPAYDLGANGMSPEGQKSTEKEQELIRTVLRRVNMERALVETQTVKEENRSGKEKYQTPSPNQNRSGLLRKPSDIGEKNRPRPGRDLQYYSREEDSAEREGQFPLIELPNPQAEIDPNRGFVILYRPWTQRDVEMAVEGIPHPKTGMAGFERDLNGLASSFRLNTGEVERAVRTIVGKDWFAARGAWVPTGNNGDIIQWSAGLGEPFRVKITELCANLTEHYHRHADFSKFYAQQENYGGRWHTRFNQETGSGSNR